MLTETVIRKNLSDEITLEVEIFNTSSKKNKRKAFETLERLDCLQYHYFSQEYEALKSCYINCMCYMRYRKHRYLTGFISWHVSSMNKVLRNVFFGSEFFGKFRKHMLDNYQIPAKFLTISRFVLFPQFRGVGLASKFIEIAVKEIEKQPDVMMLEVYSSMLYNFDFMPDDWVKYVNVLSDEFVNFEEYTKFCRKHKIVRDLEDAKKVLNRAIKRVQDGGRVRAADNPNAQIESQAKRILSAAGEDDLLDNLDSKKRNQSFRQSKQMVRRVPRADKFIKHKSGSMYNRMSDQESFVNIASYMFYIAEHNFKYFNEYFCIDDMINYRSLLDSYKDFGNIYMDKVMRYKKHRQEQVPVFVELFVESCNIDVFRHRDTRLQSQTSQQTNMAAKNSYV